MIFGRKGLNRFGGLVFRPAGLVAAVVFAGGCAAFQPVGDVTQQYVLDPDSNEAQSAEEAENVFLVALDRVDAPRYLEPPGIAVREERHRIRHSLDHRWAEPLDLGLGRLLREKLGREPMIGHVFGRVAEPADLVLRVQVLRCEGIIDEEGARGVFRASWEISDGAGSGLAERGSLSIDDLPWDGENYGMLVAGLSDAANRLAKEIAADLRRLAGKE